MIAVVRENIGRTWQSGRMHVVAAYATVNLVSAVTGILIARSAGTIRYGGYAILASQAALAGSLIPLGSPLHILRSADRDEVDRAVRAAVVLTAISAAISLPLLGIVFRIPAAGLIASGCTAVAALTSAMLPRTRGPRRAAAAQAAGAVALLAAVIVLYTFDVLTPHRLIVVSGVAALAAPFVYRAVRDDWARAMRAAGGLALGRHLRSSAALLIGNGLSSAALISLPLVASLRVTREDVGFLRAALSISALLGGLVSLLATQQFLPQLAALRGSTDLRAHVAKAAREQLIFLGAVGALFIAGVVIVGEWFVTSTFGPEFSDVGTILPVAAAVEVLKAVVSVELGIMFVYGRLAAVVRIELIAAALIAAGAFISILAFESVTAVIIGVGVAYIVVGFAAAATVARTLPRAAAP